MVASRTYVIDVTSGTNVVEVTLRAYNTIVTSITIEINVTCKRMNMFRKTRTTEVVR